jgi:glycerol-3-phosphate dehydrogenase (NAD(P)+)
LAQAATYVACAPKSNAACGIFEAMQEVQQVVEGVYSAKAALQLADKYETEAPIIRAVNRVLFGNEKPMQAVEDLMLRDSRIENSGLEW